MKAVVSNRIYLEADASLQAKIDKELTYSIPSYNTESPPFIIKNMGIIRPGLITIPVGRFDLIPTTYEVVDKRVLVPTEFPEFKFKLRASQQEIHDDVDDNCIINAKVSWGKTFAGLAIAGNLGQKTLVVTHTVPLRNQWCREVNKVYGFNPGIIGSGKYDVSTPIVVGNTQTLYKKIPEISGMFGTVILDEMHHVSSTTFGSIMDKSRARYKIGLSGTIKRKDGKHVVFQDYFGPKIYIPPTENSMRPEVHIIETNIRFPDGATIPWALRVNDLVSQDEYRHLVAILSSKYAAEGHKVLTVSDRVHFLKVVAGMIGPTAVAVTGDIKDHDERDKIIASVDSGGLDVICGTQAMFSEGMSHNPLSCLILGTPVSNEPLLEQLIGRIVRENPGKQTPVVVDIHLKGSTATRQANLRMGHYIRKGYTIRTQNWKL